MTRSELKARAKQKLSGNWNGLWELLPSFGSSSSYFN